MASLQVRNLEKRYGGFAALRLGELTVADGLLAVALGPSGSGKTTLLRLIAGLEPPTSGEVMIAGQPVTGVPAHRRDVAMVFQGDALLPHLTVEENVAFPLRMAKWSEADIRVRVDAVVSLAGAESFRRRRPDELSGGQRQLAAIGRSLARRPRLWLLDEPLAHLDAPLRSQMLQVIADIQRQTRVTTLFVTHDQQEAMQLADHLFVLDEGDIAFAGEPAAAYDHPPTLDVAKFLGSPAMNLWRWNSVKQALGDAIHPPTSADAAALMVGLRPEQIRLGLVRDGKSTTSESVACRADVIEVKRIGAATQVALDVGGLRINGVTMEAFEDPLDEPLAVEFAKASLHWFDERSGRRIELAGASP